MPRRRCVHAWPETVEAARCQKCLVPLEEVLTEAGDLASQYMVISGNTISGMVCHGPFVDANDAVRFGQWLAAGGIDVGWWVSDLRPVYAPEPQDT